MVPDAVPPSKRLLQVLFEIFGDHSKLPINRLVRSVTIGKPMANEKRNIVIAGGGFGGLFTALDLAGAGDVTLISDEDHFLFAPMLYEYLSGEVEEWHIAPQYKELLDQDINLVQDGVAGIDLQARTVSLANYSLKYDVLVIALGGISN